MQDESLGSEQDAKESGPKALKYKALVPLLIAFNPSPSDAVAMSLGAPGGGGSRPVASRGASLEMRARWPEHWPEEQSKWYKNSQPSTVATNAKPDPQYLFSLETLEDLVDVGAPQAKK